MAGHSKFKNIMHRKGAADKKKAALFTKLAREIQVAAKNGADPASNARLARAIIAARAESMPKDNIQRAIDKASGAGSDDLVEMRYEGFGPGGVGVIVEAATDNRNRTASEVRAAFTRFSGNLGETGSVSFLWDQVGEIRYPLAAAAEDAMLEAAIEAGADDCVTEEEEHVVLCGVPALVEVQAALEARFSAPASAKIVWRPRTSIPIEGDAATSLMKLLSALDDLDDVLNVYANFEISDEALAGLDA
jgi:YebC/PmpR family DNA-binding regulatory protein